MRSVRRGAGLLAVVAALPWPGDASAQVIRGRLLDDLTSTPVEAAVVELLDSGGERRAAVLSGTGGSYVVRLPRPGRYALRVRRLGYRTADFGPWRIDPDEARVEDLRLPPAPVALAGVVARGERRCVVDPEAGSDAAVLWDQARKVLEVAALVTREGLYTFEIARFRRRLTVDGGSLLSEDAALDVASRPFESPPADSLVTQGFVQWNGTDLAFYMPDPEVVLTRAFVETHCFRVADHPTEPGRIGLAFEPLEGREPSDVRGILWMDRETGAVRSLEYGYHAPLDAIREHGGGWAEFERLENGAWVIRRWLIRMPTMARARRGRTEVTDLVEEGGELLEVTTRSGRLLSRRPQGVVTGVVTDSLRGGAPLRGAVVRAVGTPYADTTDAAGRFRITGLPPGQYALTYLHPRLDTLAISLPVREVRVPREGDVRLAIPSRATLVPRLCGRMDPAGPLGVVSSVVTRRDGTPAAGVEVELGFREEGRSRMRTFRTGENGFIRFCSVPPGPVSLRVEGDAGSAGSAGSGSAELPVGGFVRIDLRLPGSPAGVSPPRSASPAGPP